VHTLIHELGHVLGLMHTQKRRDAAAAWVDPWTGAQHGPHLRIHWNNIKPEKWSQYLPDYYQYVGSGSQHAPFRDGTNLDPHTGYASYDYSSIMHYRSNSWTTGNGQSFETGMGHNFDQTIGRTSKILSDGDVDQLADMYRCGTDELYIQKHYRKDNHMITWIHYKEAGLASKGDSVIVMTYADGSNFPQSWRKSNRGSNARDELHGFLLETFNGYKRISMIRYLPRTDQWIVVSDMRYTLFGWYYPAQQYYWSTSHSGLEARLSYYHSLPGYIITDIAYGNGYYYVVSTELFYYSQRCHWSTSWDLIKTKIEDDWNLGYHITFLDKLDGKWYLCSTTSTGIGYQWWAKRSSQSAMLSYIQSKFSSNAMIQILTELPNSEGYIVVMSVMYRPRSQMYPQFAPTSSYPQSYTVDRAYGGGWFGD
jgi:hypothetical protein